MPLRQGDKRLRSGLESPRYKTAGVSIGTLKRRAKLTPIGPCADCGGEAIDRVFPDGGPRDLDNPEFISLCRSCHMARDGRAEKLKAIAAINSANAKTVPKPCVNCGTPYKPLRLGRCGACSMFFSKRGAERPSETKPTDPRVVCDCGKMKDVRSKRCWACDKKRSVDEAGEKLCRGCNRVLPLGEFGIRRGARPRSRCKECEFLRTQEDRATTPREILKARKLAWELANPEAHRRYIRRRSIRQKGIPDHEIESILAAVDAVTNCEICGDPISASGRRSVCVDHCHKTGKFRGLLCSRCNTGLGQFRENEAIFLAAIEYLKRDRKLPEDPRPLEHHDGRS